MKKLELTGQRFGRLVVIGEVGKNKSLRLCRCDCGNEKVIMGYNLTSGATKSCGCFKHSEAYREKISKSVKEYYRKNVVYKNLLSEYGDMPEAIRWIKRHKAEIDLFDDVDSVYKLAPCKEMRVSELQTDSLLYGIGIGMTDMVDSVLAAT